MGGSIFFLCCCCAAVHFAHFVHFVLFVHLLCSLLPDFFCFRCGGPVLCNSEPAFDTCSFKFWMLACHLAIMQLNICVFEHLAFGIYSCLLCLVVCVCVCVCAWFKILSAKVRKSPTQLEREAEERLRTNNKAKVSSSHCLCGLWHIYPVLAFHVYHQTTTKLPKYPAQNQRTRLPKYH